ncbi:MAG: phosphoenolpyruvate carboxykinase, partial [Candidatus Diapherotrites archaeon]|nr:phosphoenolpyruvate carboxykinase [Candidatus Diapherotrites archaeon]
MQLLCKPDKLEWLDGSETEKQRLIKEAVKKGELVELNQKKIPGCYLHRSAPNDVSRTENLTFICTSRKEDTTPLANWMAPKEAYKKLGEIFEGAMKGRTMYVVPFIMGIPKSKFSKVCVQLTDSVYVALNIRILARMGKIAWKEL